MRKNLIFTSLVIIILLLVTFLSPLIIKKLLVNYLDSKLSANCNIESISLSLDKIIVKRVELKDDDFSFKLDSFKVDYAFKGFFVPELKLFEVSGANLRITDLEGFKTVLSGLTPESLDKEQKEEVKQIFNLYLKDIAITVDQSPKLFLDLDFSFDGSLTANELIDLRGLKVDKFDLKTDAISCAFRVEQVRDREYILYIDSIKRQEEEIGGMSLPFVIGNDSIFIKEAPFLFFGPANKIEGKFEFFDMSNFCFRVLLKTATFSNAINFFGQEENVIFNGLFNGRFDLCFKDGDLASFSGNLETADQGMINIRKEVSFDFLKQYLEERSYEELVDSFNNYTYNGGKISLKKQAETISVHFDFSSESRGKRNIVINYHLPR